MFWFSYLFSRVKSCIALAAVLIIAGCASEPLPPVETTQAMPASPAALTEMAKSAVAQSKDLKCTPKGMKSRRYSDEFKNFVDHHVLISDPEGEVVKDTSYGGDDYETRYKKIIRAFKESGTERMLIYVNGGLNSKKLVLDQAARQIPCMYNERVFPVFLIWDTSAFPTYVEQVGRVRNGRLIKREKWDGLFLTLTAPMHVLSDIVKGIGRAPATYSNSSFRFANSTSLGGWNPFFNEAEYSLTHFLNSEEYMKEKSKGENGLYYNVKIDKNVRDEADLDVLELTAYSVASPARLLTIPFLDSFGKTAWENMKRRTRTPFRSVSELQPEFQKRGTAKGNQTKSTGNNSTDLPECYPKGKGVFSKFFQDLARSTNPNGNGCLHVEIGREIRDKVKLTLIGHSMGTMVLNEIIPRYATKLKYENIVYLAAATSIREFSNTVLSTLESAETVPGGDCEREVVIRLNCNTNFHSLMLHPLLEAKETSVYGAAVSGSLLEWIDDIFEGPQTVLDRTLGMWRNVKPAMHAINKDVGVKKRMTFRVFGYNEARRKNLQDGQWYPESAYCEQHPGLCDKEEICDSNRYWPADPRKHGAFNDDESCFWVSKFWSTRPEGVLAQGSQR